MSRRMDKSSLYERAGTEILTVLDDEGGFELDAIARMATVASVLANTFETFFWTGFYRVDGERLVIGPYMGTVGCLVIPFGKGVCGTAAAKQQTLIVPDVREFPGHIACDERSRSEIVVPVFDASRAMIAVLDVDSDRLDAFDDMDRAGLESICRHVFGRYRTLAENPQGARTRRPQGRAAQRDSNPRISCSSLRIFERTSRSRLRLAASAEAAFFPRGGAGAGAGVIRSPVISPSSFFFAPAMVKPSS